MLGEPLLFGSFAASPRGGVVLRSVTARVRTNTAAADIRIVMCRAVQGDVGGVLGTAEAFCSSVRPVEGTNLGGNPSDHLVIEVTPRQPGEVAIDGVDVSYTAGLRRGTEATGVRIRVGTAGVVTLRQGAPGRH